MAKPIIMASDLQGSLPHIRDLVGVPFVNGGRNVAEGLDCWGLVMEVFRQYGITLPDFTIDTFAYQAIDALAGEEIESRKWEEVYNPTDRDVPLVILMRMHPNLITHAGVLLRSNRIIHTMKCTGVVISRLIAFKSRIAGYYRPC